MKLGGSALLPLNAALVASEKNAAIAEYLGLRFVWFYPALSYDFKVLGVNKSRFVLLLVCCFRSRLGC